MLDNDIRGPATKGYSNQIGHTVLHAFHKMFLHEIFSDTEYPSKRFTVSVEPRIMTSPPPSPARHGDAAAVVMSRRP
jgi:hypothetical protein